jgi:hypothetical protein
MSELHYSGKNSVEFWKRINALPQPQQDTLYNMGCTLQDFECRLRKVHCKSCDKTGYLQPDQMSTNCPDPRCRENDEDAEVMDLGNVEISREELDKARPWR